MRKTFSTPAFSHFHDKWHLSPALDTGDFIFFSGVTGCQADGTVASDPQEQFRDAFTFVADTLPLVSYHGNTTSK